MDNELDKLELSIENELEESSIDNVFPTVIKLPLGLELACSETYNISSCEDSTFIILAGSIGCGKTTLIVSIYNQMFQNKMGKRYFFAGSKTLQAFEERAYYTRTMSNQSQPNMQRTISGTLDSILHLRLLDQKNDTYKNLLLADFSGEDFDNVASNIEVAKEDFKIVKSSKILVLLLDGEKICNNYRHKEVQKCIHLLRTFSDANILNKKVKILAIVSKYDLILKENNEEIFEFVNDIQNKISEQIPQLKSKIEFLKIAAMPVSENDINVGFGVEELVDLLLAKDENKIVAFETITPRSQFNLYSRRHIK